MKHITKLKLTIVHKLCDQHDKSTEFMLQAMQDTCNVPLDCVLNYLENTPSETKELYHQEIISLSETIENTEKLLDREY